jgi:hypothetical protein
LALAHIRRCCQISEKADIVQEPLSNLLHINVSTAEVAQTRLRGSGKIEHCVPPGLVMELFSPPVKAGDVES